jgi:glycosyltransferase involved in cell wall biosynthesis
MPIVCHLIKATRLSGAERHLMILLPSLRERGIDARLLMLVEKDKPMDNIMQEAQTLGVPIERILIRRGLGLTSLGAIRQAIARMQPDILHTHLIHADTLGLLAMPMSGVKHLLTTRHNDDAFRQHLPIRLLSGFNWRSVRAGIAISDSIARFVKEVEFANPNKVQRIHYGLPHVRPSGSEIQSARQKIRTELNLAPDTQLIGMMSRLTAQKGVSYGLEAMKFIHQTHPQAHLVIAGDGELLGALQARARVLQLEKHTHFLGWRSDASTLLRSLDIFLMPSLWEGFGLALLEAMGARLPAVASAVSALPEIIVHHETGYLVPPRNPEAIAQAVRLLLDDPLLGRYMGLNAEDRLETYFDVPQMANQTVQLYKQVLGI